MLNPVITTVDTELDKMNSDDNVGRVAFGL